MKKTLGQHLRELRGDRSQVEVAQALGISKMALSSYELDKRIPRDSIKIKIAEFYNVSVQDIFFNSDVSDMLIGAR